MKIDLHIDRVVLHGVAVEAGGQAFLQTAVETELARLLAAGGLGEAYAAGGSFDFIHGGSIQLDQPRPPRDPHGADAGLGHQIASALSGSLGAVK